jgi:hypothetical protein
LIRPRAKWLRILLGCAFIAGGLFGFLPFLGFWMLPLGALLIGRDIPPVRRNILHMLERLRHWCNAQDGKER